MPSRREVILDKIRLALEAITGSPPYESVARTVSREFKPVEELPVSAYPILFVSGAGEPKTPHDTEQLLARLRVEVRGYVRRAAGPATGGAALSTTLNALLADVERAVFVDETLGGEAACITPLEVVVDEISLDEVAGFLQPFEVQYHYTRGQP